MEVNIGSRQSLRDYALIYLPKLQMHYNKADSIRKAL